MAQMKKRGSRAKGFIMDGADTVPVKFSKLPLLAIPTEDCRYDGHHIFRHLPKIREGKIERDSYAQRKS